MKGGGGCTIEAEYFYLYYLQYTRAPARDRERGRIKTVHRRVHVYRPVYFYDIILIYIDAPAAGDRRGFIEIKRNFIRRMWNFRYRANCVSSDFISAYAHHKSERLSYFADYRIWPRHRWSYPRISYFESRNYFQIIRPLLSFVASINNWAITGKANDQPTNQSTNRSIGPNHSRYRRARIDYAFLRLAFPRVNVATTRNSGLEIARLRSGWHIRAAKRRVDIVHLIKRNAVLLTSNAWINRQIS